MPNLYAAFRQLCIFLIHANQKLGNFSLQELWMSLYFLLIGLLKLFLLKIVLFLLLESLFLLR